MLLIFIPKLLAPSLSRLQLVYLLCQRLKDQNLVLLYFARVLFLLDPAMQTLSALESAYEAPTNVLVDQHLLSLELASPSP